MTNRNMGDDGLNDTDIAAMFAADSTEPPAALDKLVLANAHAPVADIEDEYEYMDLELVEMLQVEIERVIS